jgi:hypothetical protein
MILQEDATAIILAYLKLDRDANGLNDISGRHLVADIKVFDISPTCIQNQREDLFIAGRTPTLHYFLLSPTWIVLPMILCQQTRLHKKIPLAILHRLWEPSQLVIMIWICLESQMQDLGFLPLNLILCLWVLTQPSTTTRNPSTAGFNTA